MDQCHTYSQDLKKPDRVVLMHGKDANPTSNKWYVWLEELLKEKGIQFVAPVLPKADNPVLQDWLDKLEKINPDEETILISHSRGGVAIMRWLERAKNVKVKKVILVATNSGDYDKGGSFYVDGAYNYKKIKEHCADWAVIHSKDDEWVPFESGVKNAAGLEAKFYQLDGKGHFGRKVEDIPELEYEIFV